MLYLDSDSDDDQEEGFALPKKRRWCRSTGNLYGQVLESSLEQTKTKEWGCETCDIRSIVYGEHLDVCGTCTDRLPYNLMERWETRVKFWLEHLDPPLSGCVLHNDFLLSLWETKVSVDFRIYRRTHTVCFEVDENQHKSYIGEMARMLKVKRMLYDVPTIFIRWNPHNYTNSEGRFKRQATTRERFKLLEKELRLAIDNPPVGSMDVVYLFYDYDLLEGYRDPRKEGPSTEGVTFRVLSPASSYG